jgi:hypothetical protein
VRDEIERKVREAVGLTSFGEGDDEPIRIDDAESPPPEDPPMEEEPAAAGRSKTKSST